MHTDQKNESFDQPSVQAGTGTGLKPYSLDPRFSYCLFVPPRPTEPCGPPGLVVAVHDSTRNPLTFRDRFIDFAERWHQVVLAPLFPSGVRGDGNGDGYKLLMEGDIRYDQVLQGMVAEAAALTGCDAVRFFLFGYSGGGQFVHRYLLLHPERLRAVCVGAPGEVTLMDAAVDWWGGIRDTETRFGHAVDVDAVRRVPIQLLVGSDDVSLEELREQPESRFWASRAERTTANRIVRLEALQRSLQEAGVHASLRLMPGLRHGDGGAPAAALGAGFFASHLAAASRSVL